MKSKFTKQNDPFIFFFFFYQYSLSSFTSPWNHRFHYDLQTLKSWRGIQEKEEKLRGCIKIRDGRARKWAGKNFGCGGRALARGKLPSQFPRGETQWRSLVVYLKISLMYVRLGLKTPLLTVHAYWAIPRHECRHEIPERNALHRFHVPPALIELVHREPTQLLGYRSLVISKEIPAHNASPASKLLSLFDPENSPFFPLSSSSSTQIARLHTSLQREVPTNTVYK